MSEALNCTCGQAFLSKAGSDGLVRCPRCMKAVANPPASDALLGYMGPSSVTPVISLLAVELIRQTTLWVRIISILLFIGSALMFLGGGMIFFFSLATGRTGPAFLGCLYIPLALLYIIPANFLFRYATNCKAFAAGRQIHHLEIALQSQKSFWKFVGVLALIVLGFYLLLIPLAILAAFHP